MAFVPWSYALLYRLALPLLMFLYYMGSRPQIGPDGVAVPEQAGGLRWQLLQWVLEAFGIGKLAPQDVSVLTLAMLAYSFVLGQIAHMALKDKAFGPGLNGLIGLAGACGGLVLFGRFSGAVAVKAHPELVAATVVGVSMLLLAGASALKGFVIVEATAAINGDRRVATPKASSVKADRMDMVIRRRS